MKRWTETVLYGPSNITTEALAYALSQTERNGKVIFEGTVIASLDPNGVWNIVSLGKLPHKVIQIGIEYLKEFVESHPRETVTQFESWASSALILAKKESFFERAARQAERLEHYIRKVFVEEDHDQGGNEGICSVPTAGS